MNFVVQHIQWSAHKCQGRRYSLFCTGISSANKYSFNIHTEFLGKIAENCNADVSRLQIYYLLMLEEVEAVG